VSGGAPASLLARFEGDRGQERLRLLLQAQAALCCDADAIREIAAAAALREYAPSDILIRQDEADTDLFFILSGRVRVFVNGREVAERSAGHHVGEMAIVDPASRRTSTVIAAEHTLVARIEAELFLTLADRNPRIWQAVAVELSRRLDQRKKFHAQPNSQPIVFVGSSRESLKFAEALRDAIPAALASVTIWSERVFGASDATIESLEAQLGIADFAVLVAAADDRVESRGARSAAPRDNVIFELGLFMGALSRRRTFLLMPRGAPLKIPSDLAGITPLQFDSAEPDLAKALKAAAEELAEIIGRKGAK
jgi:CRP/FNR family cyclic AMP-dependent transcriptional regulator